jgi:ribosome-binding factor A
MDARRAARLSGQIKREIASILTREIKDPRLGFVSVVRVSLSQDGSHAKVYFSTMGSDEEREESCAAMESSKPYIRRQLADRIRMRSVPELQLIHDHSIEEGERVLRIIRSLEED